MHPVQRLVVARADAPWFRRRPPMAVALAGVLFAAIFALRLMFGMDTTEGITMLYALPITLLALALGRRGGVAAGLVAVALVAVWVVVDSVELGLLGWASRTLPHLLVGVLLGDASDRLQRAEQLQRTHEIAELRHRQAVEINDTLVQGMAAAKWAMESGRHDRAMQTLEETLETGQRLVSDLMRDADMGIDGQRGHPDSSAIGA
ncbi:hypothetical protein [Nocardioides pacificus]